MAGLPAVFLDRDGIINRTVVREGKPYPPARPDDVEILPGTSASLQCLVDSGYILIGVTNQPDVARGTQSRETVESINALIQSSLPVREIFVCYHDNADECDCRKPKPGLILQAAQKYGLDLSRSWMVGDRWKDIAAGQAAGLKTIFVDYHYAETYKGAPADFTVEDTALLADIILKGSKMKTLDQLKVKIFADGADLDGILELYRNPHIKGFTTNPTLMRKSGISDYENFARQVLEQIHDRPISFEVFSDEFDEMERQARKIASWGKNVYIKIPVTNTRSESSGELVRRLAADGVQLNVTALMPLEQVRMVSAALGDHAPAYISVFAGRIADTGYDPLQLMKEAVEIMARYPNQELIWASPRELLNIFQADEIGCHVITVTHDILKKLSLVGKDLDEYSLDTVKMFRDDAVKAGYVL